MVTARITSVFLLALALAGVTAQAGFAGATADEVNAPALASANATYELIWHAPGA
ncbi:MULTISPECIES: hypothetical protein [unclassified Streptomyces]|uniref:hypothetical protein n=1 Tax=unclassified Streptomyces TaxID=2593676 RepID=UPI00225490A8|nr:MULTISPECIES: hypothetical protein [unclassified Streptomyces]MCX4527053.1 hypothetical protein [Streptomyces sp. NBC_01551]MCX4542387.1 hypothetical protein [Streptomyces sp. NBC_01565]